MYRRAKNERDLEAAMCILLDRDVRPSGQHIPENTPKVTEATKVILRCRYIVSDSVDKAFKRRCWSEGTDRFIVPAVDPAIVWERRN